jgi:uroporphyrinogen-III synthase
MLVFYSREAEKAQQIQQFCSEHGFQLLAQSLISFEAVQFHLEDKNADVIFFTSPRSFDYFTAQESIQSAQEIACIGIGTKNHIESHGFQVSFYGQDSTHPDVVAKDFTLWLGARRVLFPISNISNRSVQKVLAVEQYQEVVVYNTVSKSVELESQPDILIFSSPSNAAAFLEKNSIYPDQKVACFGTTTKRFLASRKIEAVVLTSPDEEGVLEYLGGISKRL